MTHEQLPKKVAEFVHGANSRGGVLMPWTHEKGCGMCDGILEIVEAVIGEQKDPKMDRLQEQVFALYLKFVLPETKQL